MRVALPGFARVRTTISVFRWVVVVGLLLWALPVLSFWQPTLEGIFAELDAVSIALAAMAVLMAAWSLVFVAGMLVEGAETRVRRDGHEHRRATRDGGPLVPWVERHFGVPTRNAQGVLAVVLAAPALGVLVGRAEDRLFGSVAMVGGVAVAWVLVEVLSAPVRGILGRRWRPERDRRRQRVAERLTSWARGWFRLCLAVLTWAFTSAPSRWVGFDDVVETDETGRQQLAGNHFMAFAATFGACLVLGFFLVASAPPEPLIGFQLPTAALVFVLVSLLVWVGGAIDYHAARYALPVTAVAVVFVAGIALFSGLADHHYDGAVVPVREGAEPRGRAHSGLTPVDVAGARDGGNLVVVCAAGGGILASGWTALALTELVAERPRLLGELRLVSAVSGGSVGAAYFLEGLLSDDALPHRDAPDWAPRWDRRGAGVRAASVASSLEAVTFGLVFHDVPHLLSAGLTGRWVERDRGSLLEAQWHQAAREHQGAPPLPPTLAALAGPIRDGRIPAPIFNATAMEVGRRVMITPVRFEPGWDEALPRAPTLSEYVLAGEDASFVDLSLWTAARLSATFPYVTPAARWELSAERLTGGDQRAAHHMIDGGYYDNYGVASALDWLRVVLDHRLGCGAGCEHVGELRRVAIVHLRAFPLGDPRATPPSSNFLAALAGPAVGIARIRDGTATSRNEIDERAFIAAWGARMPDVAIESFVLEPGHSNDPGPLSWRLTPSQVRAMRARWDDPFVQHRVDALMRFLGP